MGKRTPKISILVPTRRGNTDLVVNSVICNTDLDYELIIESKEMGFNEKLNSLYRKAMGDYIVILHDDCEVCSGWLDELNKCGAFHVGEWCDTHQMWGGFYPGNEPCQDPKKTPFYNIFCMLSREVADKVFPLDEKFTDPWGQDVDMGFKIREAGYKFKCLKGKIIHYQTPHPPQKDEQVLYLRKKWHVK